MSENIGNSTFFLVLGLSGLTLVIYFVYRLYEALGKIPDVIEPQRIEIDQPQVRLGRNRNVVQANQNNPHFRRRRIAAEGDDEQENEEQRRIMRAYEKKKRYLEKQKQREIERKQKLKVEEKIKKGKEEQEKKLRKEYSKMFNVRPKKGYKSKLFLLIQYLKEHKTVYLEDIISSLDLELSEEELKERLKWMLATRQIHGFFNKEETKLFYLERDELKAIESYFKSKKRISLTDFKEYLNQKILLES